MSLIGLEPNILLILLGSLFVLIGTSGKIFIERFSVDIGSTGPRFFVCVLGMAMLVVGIIGPNKLLTNTTDALGVKSTAVSSEKQWLSKVPGTYAGVATSSGTDHPVNTTFNIDSQGNVTGTYVIEESRSMMGGKLERSQVLGLGTIQFDWKDDGGHGKLRITFSDDVNSFTGNWGDDGQLDLGYRWAGKKK